AGILPDVGTAGMNPAARQQINEPPGSSRRFSRSHSFAAGSVTTTAEPSESGQSTRLAPAATPAAAGTAPGRPTSPAAATLPVAASIASTRPDRLVTSHRPPSADWGGPTGMPPAPSAGFTAH